MPSRPTQATTVFSQTKSARDREGRECGDAQTSGFPPSLRVLARRLTVGDEGGDKAGGAGHDVGGGEGNAAADAFDGEEDEEGGRELHQAGDEEVDVDVSFQNAQPHDQALVDHSTGEPGGESEELLKLL